MPNLKRMTVTHVLDHHKLGDLTTSGPVFLRFEPVGCTATILAKLYFEHFIIIDRTTAALIISAIISDTLFFRFVCIFHQRVLVRYCYFSFNYFYL